MTEYLEFNTFKLHFASLDAKVNVVCTVTVSQFLTKKRQLFIFGGIQSIQSFKKYVFGHSRFQENTTIQRSTSNPCLNKHHYEAVILLYYL